MQAGSIRVTGRIVVAVLFSFCAVSGFAADYGFGKVVTLGSKDNLIREKNLLFYTDDTVAFRYVLTGPSREVLSKDNLENLEHYKVTCDGDAVDGIRVLGHMVRISHMGHMPTPYSPHTYSVHVYIRLPQPMVEGKKYTFTSRGIDKETKSSLVWSAGNVLSECIKVNQIGYLPQAGIRLAYFGKWLGSAGALQRTIDSFSLIDLETGKVAYKGKATVRHKVGGKEDAYGDMCGENVSGLDFSAFSKPGSYCVSIPGIGRSYSFRIGKDVMAEPLFTSIRALFHERCGIALTKTHTPWVRKKCKMHCKIAAYPEYGPALTFKSIKAFLEKGKADGTIKYLTVKGGYHDAGDYDRRPMHLKIGEMLCSAYDINPKAFIDEQFVMPESGNGIPDILDEAYFLLSYYLDTQWPDGGISDGSEAWEHPKNNTSNAWATNTENEITEYVQLPTSQEACFAYAASAAHLGRLMQEFPAGKAQGTKLVTSAAKAFDCGMKKFPPRDLKQKILVGNAAAQLLHSTRNKRFAAALNGLGLKEQKIDYIDPVNVRFAFSVCSVPKSAPDLDQSLQAKVVQDAEQNVGWATSAFTTKKGYIHYKHPWAPTTNGTSSTGQVYPMALMWKMTGKKKYYDLLSASADVCLGANPMGQVQCSGLGQKHILHPLFLESMNDKLEEYLPGIWVYGPARGTHWIWGKTHNTPGPKQTPDLYRYIDIDQSPPQTEFTVGENLGPAVLLFGSLAPEDPKAYKGPLPTPK